MASAAPAPESTSLRDSLGEAREELSRETDTGAGTGGGGGEGGAPAGGAAPTKAEIETFIENATAEELEQIKGHPVLSKVYNSMLRDYKGKTTKLSEERRTLEAQAEEQKQAKDLFDAMRDNPELVIRAIAERRGMTVTEARKAAAAAETDAELVELFGDDATAIKPAFDKAINTRVEAHLKPIVDHMNAEAKAQLQREIGNDLVEFKNELKKSGDDLTDEVAAEMNALVKKIDPAEGVDNREYIRMLYKIATSGKTKATVTKEVTARMRQNARDLEPKDIPSGAATGDSGITKDMNLRAALRHVRETGQTKGR
jgi:hypothetical protein